MRVIGAALASCLLSVASASAQTTAFTYQGRLTDGAAPADGAFDFQLRLFDVATGGTALATVDRSGVAVALGLFTVSLDFGAQFTGGARFVEVAVRPAGGGAYTTLGERQAITSAPYASRSATAGAADSAATAQSATTALAADALGPACVLCVLDPQIAAVSGAKVTGQVPVAAIPPGSPAYVQNATTEQAGTSFNVSGTGRVGDALTALRVNVTTEYRVNDERVLAVGGSQNVFLGRNAGPANTTGFGNTFLGHFAGNANATSVNHTFVGTDAGRSNTIGHGNTFVGRSSGFDTTTGFQNVFVGLNAGRFNVGGAANIMIGSSAGANNTDGVGNVFIGFSAGASNTVEDRNTFVGYNTNGAAGVQNATAIGANAVVTASDTMVLGVASVTVRTGGNLVVGGSAAVTTLGTAGATSLCRNAANLLATCSSSLRYKTDVRPLTAGLDLVRRLAPITFTWRETGARDLGFAAETVAAVDPLLAVYDEQGRVEGVKYGQLTAVLVNAMREQQAQLDAQRAELRALRAVVCRLSPDDETCR